MAIFQYLNKANISLKHLSNGNLNKKIFKIHYHLIF
jgi:hypothetical protein